MKADRWRLLIVLAILVLLPGAWVISIRVSRYIANQTGDPSIESRLESIEADVAAIKAQLESESPPR